MHEENRVLHRQTQDGGGAERLGSVALVGWQRTPQANVDTRVNDCVEALADRGSNPRSSTS